MVHYLMTQIYSLVQGRLLVQTPTSSESIVFIERSWGICRCGKADRDMLGHDWAWLAHWTFNHFAPDWGVLKLRVFCKSTWDYKYSAGKWLWKHSSLELEIKIMIIVILWILRWRDLVNISVLVTILISLFKLKL